MWQKPSGFSTLYKDMKIRACFHLVAAAVLCTMLCMCGGEKKQTPVTRHRVSEEPAKQENPVVVKVESVVEDSITVTYKATGEKKTFCYGRAQMDGNVKGSITKGDYLSVLPEDDTRNIRFAVNISELEGLWFYDTRQHRGFRFGINGGLSSVNMLDVSFRNWFVKDGNLTIYYVDMQQRADSEGEFWVDESEIIHLDRNRLDLRFRDTVLVCRRKAEPVKFRMGSKQ